MKGKKLFGEIARFEIHFAIGSKVELLPLGVEGRILGVWITETGKKYEVRYFDKGDAKQAYFFEDEILVKQDK